MAHAYTPGLTVTNRVRHRVRRLLPIAGELLVEKGQTVQAEQVVAQTFLPGNVTPINLANLLSLPPADVPECVLKQEGERIEEGEVLARTKGLLGFFKQEYKARISGTLETISGITGQVIVRGEPLPVQVKAYMTGEVVELLPNEGVVIEADVSFIQGIFGIGGEVFGPICMACDSPQQELTPERITAQMRGQVIVGGGRMTGAAVHKAVEVGAAAVVSGGIDDADLREILGYDLGVAVTGSESIGVSLVITEGFGPIAMAERTFELLKCREGDSASVNGSTQIRAGVMRPELIIPLSAEEKQQEREPVHEDGMLAPGRRVRVIRDPWFGRRGEVSALPPEPTKLESGSLARVLQVNCDNGETITVPRANVELVER